MPAAYRPERNRSCASVPLSLWSTSNALKAKLLRNWALPPDREPLGAARSSLGRASPEGPQAGRITSPQAEPAAAGSDHAARPRPCARPTRAALCALDPRSGRSTHPAAVGRAVVPAGGGQLPARLGPIAAKADQASSGAVPASPSETGWSTSTSPAAAGSAGRGPNSRLVTRWAYARTTKLAPAGRPRAEPQWWRPPDSASVAT